MSPSGSSDVFTQILATDVDEDVMRAMSARERRYVLYYLLDRERVSVDELGDILAGWMAATEARVTTPPDRDALIVALYHNHLPKLADAGLVEFDAATQAVVRDSLSGPVRDLVQATYLAEHRSSAPIE